MGAIVTSIAAEVMKLSCEVGDSTTTTPVFRDAVRARLKRESHMAGIVPLSMCTTEDQSQPHENRTSKEQAPQNQK